MTDDQTPTTAADEPSEHPQSEPPKKERFFHRNPRLALGIVFGTLLLFCLTFIEIACQILLNNGMKGRSYSLLFNTKSSKVTTKVECDQSFLDPLLGYAHSDCDRHGITQIPSFVPYGPADANLKVVTLGGSTTDPIIMGDKEEIGGENWPKLFSELCAQQNKPCQVFNGGAGAFASSQELLKLIRDVRPLNPDVVISLNGINEHYFFDAPAAQYPYVSTYQQYFFRTIASTGTIARYNDTRFPENDRYQGSVFNRMLPNTRQVLLTLRQQAGGATQDAPSDGPVNFGTPAAMQPWEIWDNNVQLMHAVSQQMGAEYYVFLQPTMGIGNYDYSSEKDADLRALKNERYYEQMTLLYGEMRQRCAQLDYCFDISGAFDGKSDLYSDPRHPNAQGNQIQAEAIYQQVFAPPPAPATPAPTTPAPATPAPATPAPTQPASSPSS